MNLVQLFSAIVRHTVPIIAVLAVCAATASQLANAPIPGRCSRALLSATPGQPPAASTGMIPLTVAEIARLITGQLT